MKNQLYLKFIFYTKIENFSINVPYIKTTTRNTMKTLIYVRIDLNHYCVIRCLIVINDSLYRRKTRKHHNNAIAYTITGICFNYFFPLI